jgi:site-specific DNA-methyltransferase (adenine-specific)
MENLNKVVLGDCIKGMTQLPDNSFDIAIVDPPYNLSKGNKWKWDNSIKLKGFGGNWEKVMQKWDDMPMGDYIEFCIAWLSELKRVICPKGSIWIHGTYHNIGIINYCLQLLEIEIINEVIWYKRNSFPNLSGRRLTASHETILWAHTGSNKKREYNFNYQASKDNIFPGDLLKSQGKQMRTVWDIPNNKKKEELLFGKHPTQKPLRVSNRILEVSAPDNAKILIPFSGSGTECVAAIKNGFNFLAFETDEDYVKLSEDRIKNTKIEPTLFPGAK